MEARSLPEAFKMIMKQRGSSQNQLARDLRKGQSWISDVVNGKSGLEFAKVINLLSRVGWEVVIRPKRPKRENSDPVKRREFVAAAASVMFVPSPTAGPYQDPANVRELAGRIARGRHEHGGASIAATAMKHIRRIEPAAAGRDWRLQEAASELAIEAAWTLTDAHHFDAGEKVGMLALKLARLSKNTDAQSRAYSVLSSLNIERGSADRALMYAKEGVRLREVPETQQAWMRLRKAQTLALVQGQERAARAELESIQAPFEDTDGFLGQSSFDAADMLGNLGRAFHDVGAYPQAHSAVSEAITLFGSSSPNLQSHFLAHQVMAALRMPEMSLAADRMLALARVTVMVSSRKLDDYLKSVLAESAKWASALEIRLAREQLKDAWTPVTGAR
jgi:predicted XRE-type DNA-binding protein